MRGDPGASNNIVGVRFISRFKEFYIKNTNLLLILKYDLKIELYIYKCSQEYNDKL